MELPVEASQFVLDSQAEATASAYRLQKVADVTRSGLSLVDLVKDLRDYLIADEGDVRARATLLLAKVTCSVRSSLPSKILVSSTAAQCKPGKLLEPPPWCDAPSCKRSNKHMIVLGNNVRV